MAAIIFINPTFEFVSTSASAELSVSATASCYPAAEFSSDNSLGEDDPDLFDIGKSTGKAVEEKMKEI
ncbi:hypothetical protein AKJ16_DCAP04215 [Drosera capensis]